MKRLKSRKRSKRSMPRLVRRIELLIFSLVLALFGTVLADTSNDFDQRFYAGLGLGVSELEPESPTPALTVGDNSDQAFSLYLGMDLASRLSVEGFYSNLGEAGIQFLGSDVGAVEYQVAGLSALGYLFGSRLRQSDSRISALAAREGLSAYLRLGLGIMENESKLAYNRDHKVHFHTGLGLEYGWSNGLALRGEVIAYDSDAASAGLVLLKRFGKNRPVVDKEEPQVPPFKAVPGSRVPVKSPLIAIEPSSTYFAFGKYELIPQVIPALNQLADQLLQADRGTISIEGHTDEIDTEEYNMMLSINRATTVRDYLLSRGVEQQRMVITGFGETRPIATNQTIEGRSQNRRVEVYLR